MTTAFACGSNGLSCQVCNSGQACIFGLCQTLLSTGGGGGTGADGGTATGGGAATDGGTATGGGAQTGCSGSLVLCQSGCVDPDADENNCGGCGRTCSSGQVCDRGACKLLPTDCAAAGGCPPGFGCSPTTKQCVAGCQLNAECPTGGTCTGNQCACAAQTHACGQACASNTSTQSCGSSCTPCPVPSNGVATCDGTSCGLRCNAGSLQCGSSCVPCTAPANATATCGLGATCDFTCNAGYRRCGSGCLPDTAVTCGSSCTPCATTANGSATCTAQSACGLQCNAGYLLCGGACAACPAGAATTACSGSTCVASTCGAGTRLCNGQCATCPANATATACSGNACVATACGASTNLCAGTCKSATDVSACGPSCAVCAASTGAAATCTADVCDFRCTGSTTCKGRCGATCTWNMASSSTLANFVDVLVDAQGAVHLASVKSFRPSYHALSSGSLNSEPVSTTNDCFIDSGGFSTDSAPILVTDPAATKPGIACPRGNTMNGYRFSASAWSGSSLFSSTSFNSSARSVVQSNGLGAFARVMQGAQYVNLLRIDSDWALPQVDLPSVFVLLGGVSILRGTTNTERVAYFQQTISNSSAIDAGTVRIAEADAGAFAYSSAPWVIASAFAQERDGTVVAVDGALAYKRLVNGAWVTSSIATPMGNVYSLQLLVDPAGVIRVLWSDNSGVRLASRINGAWIVERVTTTGCYGARVSVNAAGKMAVACVSSSGTMMVFD